MATRDNFDKKPFLYSLIKFMAEWKNQGPEYFTQPITLLAPGNKSILVWNKQSGMRLTTSNTIEGNISEEQVNGSFAFLGETSVFKERPYLWRDLRICAEYTCDYSYKQTLQKKMRNL